MKKRNNQKKKYKFTTSMQKKLVILFGLVLLAFIGLSARLIIINKDSGDKYKKQVLAQQEYDSRTLPYKRGDIVDAKGTPIAMSEKVYNLILDNKLILEKDEFLEPTLTALFQSFNLDESAIRSYITQNPSSQYYIAAKKLSYEEIAPFLELQNDVENNPNIKGVWFEEEYQRIYPYDSLACDVIGFTGKDNVGSYGLEEFYNDTLNGTNGREYGYLNDDSTLERTTKVATDGNTIATSIDVNIQSIVEKYILEFNETHRDEAREGAGSSNTGVIIMDPNNGEILAMAGYPVFNLNDTKNLSGIYTSEEIEVMDEDAKFEALNALWKNFCITSTYEPGSTAKPFTISAALESGSITGNETYYCEGSMEIGGHTIHCHNRLGDGLLTVKQGLEKSCNVVLMNVGLTVGIDTFMKYQSIFNFGLKTNIDLAGEARTDSLIFDPNTMVPTDLAVSSFGQGYNVTMIQQISAFASLINGGNYYEPHVVNKILAPDGSTVKNIEPRLLKQTISEATSDIISDFCNGVVTEGTGTTARPAGYTMGGKTGTAEKVPRGTGNYVVSFMGYVPAQDPQVLIYVVIDEPNVEAQDNARYATLLTRDIMTDVLPYLNIYQTEALTEDEIEEQQLKATEQAAQTLSDNSLSDNSLSDNKADGEEILQNTQEVESSTETTENESSEIKYDPETGYAIDPSTGELLDPETGAPIDPMVSNLE